LCIALDRCKELGFNTNVDIDDLFSENDWQFGSFW
jgi:hypothetical protein